MRNEKTLSRVGWWWIGLRLSLVSVLSVTLALGSILATPSPVQAAELRVCASGCPYTSIQSAINDASSGDTIKVAQGTYSENLTVNRSVTLLGGYSPPDWTTQGPANSTIINATGKSNAVIQVLNSSVTIDNFTITGGSGYYSPWHGWTRGGGLFIWADNNPTIIISDNIIENNSAGEGGGLCIEGGGDSKFVNAQILRNIIRNNSASGNPRWGGGLSLIYTSSTIKDNTISDNIAYQYGGGFHIWHSVPTVENNTIKGNKALASEGVGGAFFIEDASAFIKNNVIANNVAQAYGDGIHIKTETTTYGPTPQIVNNTIVANKYSDSGRHEGIVVRNISTIIRNNIVALNGYGIRLFSGVSPVMSNNDVWGNNVNYSNLSPGPGDISADPLFVNQSGSDYHLQAGSPCIDAGTSSDAPDKDFEGDSRPLDGDGNGSALWDIGADEYKYNVWITKRASLSSADPGDTITYGITYRNNDESTATGVVITDILSPDLLNPNITYSGANITPRGGTTYVWDVDNLSPGSGGTITITAQIDHNVVTPTAILNTAEFYAANIGSFSDDAPIIIGGLKTYLPIIFKGY